MLKQLTAAMLSVAFVAGTAPAAVAAPAANGQPVAVFVAGSSYQQQAQTGQAATWREVAAQSEAFPYEVFVLVNQERAKAGLPEVVWDDDLARCAAIRAEEMSVKLGHERPVEVPNYRNWPNSSSRSGGVYNAPSVADELGIDYNWIYENAVYHRKTPQAAVQAWMDSPGHRAVILNENHTRCAAGVYVSETATEAGYNSYWALWFD